MKHLFILLFLLALTGCSKEQRLQEAIDGIGESNFYMGSSVGFAGMKPEEYEHYEMIVALATPQQIQDLILDDSPALRIYGLQAMVETNHPETFEAFKVLWSDKTGIGTMSGCFISEDRLSNLAVKLMDSGNKKRSDFLLEGQEKIYFDSLLLFSNIASFSPWTSALANLTPIEKHYCTIKALAEEQDYRSLLKLSLANFQREEDIPLLSELFSANNGELYSRTMEIIFRFPHKTFLSDLRTAHERLMDSSPQSFQLELFYLALFRYSPNEIAPFLEPLKDKTGNKIINRHLQSASIVAQLNNNPAKRELLPEASLDYDSLRSLEWYRKREKYARLQ